jgi:hypothetical protein
VLRGRKCVRGHAGSADAGGRGASEELAADILVFGTECRGLPRPDLRKFTREEFDRRPQALEQYIQQPAA